MDRIPMGPHSIAMNLLPLDPERVPRVALKCHAFPHGHHSRAEVHVPRAPPGDLGVLRAGLVEERTRVPLPSTPERHGP